MRETSFHKICKNSRYIPLISLLKRLYSPFRGLHTPLTAVCRISSLTVEYDVTDGWLVLKPLGCIGSSHLIACSGDHFLSMSSSTPIFDPSGGG